MLTVFIRQAIQGTSLPTLIAYEHQPQETSQAHTGGGPLDLKFESDSDDVEMCNTAKALALEDSKVADENVGRSLGDAPEVGAVRSGNLNASAQWSKLFSGAGVGAVADVKDPVKTKKSKSKSTTRKRGKKRKNDGSESGAAQPPNTKVKQEPVQVVRYKVLI